MSQHSGLAGNLTVRETVQTWARTLTQARPVAEALDQVGLTDRADVLVRSLSGGERRRLGLSLGAANRHAAVEIARRHGCI